MVIFILIEATGKKIGRAMTAVRSGIGHEQGRFGLGAYVEPASVLMQL